MWPGSREHTLAAAVLFTNWCQCYASTLPSKNMSITQPPGKLSNHVWYWDISNQINSTFSPQIGNTRTLTSKKIKIQFLAMHISLLFKALYTTDSHYSNRSTFPPHTHGHTQFSLQKFWRTQSWKHSRSGRIGLLETWSRWRCPCSLQGG